MSSQILVPAQTNAVMKVFEVKEQRNLPALIFATNLAGSEKVAFEISPDGGETFTDFFQDGVAVELNATNTSFTINALMTLRISKDVTASALSGVFLNRSGNN